MTTAPAFRYIARKRRPKEDRRFVAGAGRFVADISLPGMKHVALVTSPHPCADIVSIDTSAALALPGVLGAVTGDELAAATNALLIGVDTPKVRRFPMAVGRARYAGEWVAAVVADSRALAEDAAELVVVDYAPCPSTPIPSSRSILRHHRSIPTMAPMCCCTGSSSGGRSTTISAAPPTRSAIARAGAAAPPCRSRRSACSPGGIPALRSWMCGRPFKCRNIPTRSRAPSSCRATPCACTTTSTSAAATGSSAASSTRCWSATWRARSAARFA
ncbi:MAG: hypothetical protein HY060_05380 [Proteobacteria bacterium]|nr:hypothetical protein [Pseudomonadota bacterium]